MQKILMNKQTKQLIEQHFKPKLSSYQKLKKENSDMRIDIFNLIMHAEKESGIIAKLRWKTVFDLEQIMWMGSPTIENPPPTPPNFKKDFGG